MGKINQIIKSKTHTNLTKWKLNFPALPDVKLSSCIKPGLCLRECEREKERERHREREREKEREKER